MHRRKLILGAGTLLAAGIAGCVGTAQETQNTQHHSQGSHRTVMVRRTGTARGEPDLAVIQTGVEETGENAGRVRDALADRSDELLNALLAYGIDEDDITTSRFTIRDRIDERRMREEGVEPRSEDDLEDYRYYQGTHTFAVEVTPVDNAGEIIDTAVDAGADHIGRIVFTVSDDRREALRAEALEQAIAAAGAEAEFIAGEIDATVVEARSIDTTGGRVSPVRAHLDAEDVAADPAPTTELQPDDVTVTATVEIEYAID